MQVLTGTTSPTKTKIVVVDLDGPGAVSQWKQQCKEHDTNPKSPWIVKTGSGGYHLYYKLPNSRQSCPSGVIWGLWDTTANNGKGNWKTHCEIRILGDRSLAVAPPSKHVDTGKRYEFVRGPNTLTEAPDWILDMPRIHTPVCYRNNLEFHTKMYMPIHTELPDWQYSRSDVLDAVHDKAAVARNWGVVFTGPLSSRGWIPCFVPGREDPERSHASGSFNCDSGSLHDHATGETMSFFDVGVATGIYISWNQCLNDLGNRYLG